MNATTRVSGSTTLFALLAGVALFAALPGRVAAQGAVRCERCHGDAEFLSGKGADATADARLLVPDTILHGTEHDTLSCRSCHTNYDDAYPHQPTARTATCGSCHQAEQANWDRSMHAAPGAEDAPTCVRCHGTHRVLGASVRESPIYPLNEAALCGDCHSDRNIVDAYFTDPADSVARSAVSLYHETVHGLALEQAGLVVSATCSDCHRPHRVLPSDSMLSSVSRDSIPGTCGTCHEGVLERYLQSSHGMAFEAGDTNTTGHPAPVCNTCHSAHGVAPPDQTWKAGVIEECGECHERLYESYFDTYHGKVTRLGSALAARCSDCHTAHLNLPADDPASSVNPVNRVETCSACHGQATAGFISYLPHGDDKDRERYPQLYWTWLAMTTLLVSVFIFFGAHTLLWLTRSAIERARGGGHGAAAPQPVVEESGGGNGPEGGEPPSPSANGEADGSEPADNPEDRP